MTGWDDGLGPWKPVMRATSCTAAAAPTTATRSSVRWPRSRRCRNRALPHARCVVLIEACEESGSYDLPAYIDHLADRIGKPSLVVCLDSGCGNYDQLWCTTSLRGLAGGNFCGRSARRRRALRRCLRHRAVQLPHAAPAAVALEDENTGRILLDELHVEIPAERLRAGQARRRGAGHRDLRQVPVGRRACKPMSDDLTELVLNRTWRPALSVTGVDGMPPLDNGRQRAAPAYRGEALAAPAADRWTASALRRAAQGSAAARPALRRAKSRSTWKRPPAGWNAPALAPWLAQAIDDRQPGPSSASRRCTWAKAARSRSWACSARSSPARSS